MSWVTRLPYFAFATYYVPSNPWVVSNKEAVRQWTYHFKQTRGPHHGTISFEVPNGPPIVARTFDEARQLLIRMARRRLHEAVAALECAVAPSSWLLVPLPCSRATTLADDVGGAGRVAHALSEAGYGRVLDGLRWRTPPRSASASNPGGRPSAGEKFELLQWVADTQLDIFDTVILVDDVATYGDTSMAAANRLWRDFAVSADGLIALARTNGGQRDNALGPRTGLVTAAPIEGTSAWRASLDGTSA